VHEDLANFDALAAGTQGIFHALAAPDDRHTTQLLCKVHADILASRGCYDRLLGKWQMPQASLDNLPQDDDHSARIQCEHAISQGLTMLRAHTLTASAHQPQQTVGVEHKIRSHSLDIPTLAGCKI